MLTRLDLPENPERYFRITLERDPSGYLIVSATNLSPLPVTDFQVVANVHDGQGRLVTRAPISFQGTIPSGQTSYAPTRIGTFRSDEQLAQSVRIAISSARIGR